ncbi:hypothetical protein [Noviherbaspirillum cavernae]|uniref:hypothetical protein n=1 Tax=Noviherbaspirillum cavernae TaxID=2320862 RepID=UPI0011C47A48|nr:hypothetical protein [Noviherbaspirillum cavernae]
MPDLKVRWSNLKGVLDQLTADQRWLSTRLELHDPLVKEVQACKVPAPSPLTIGTLLASVLGEIDSVENAIRSMERRERPGQEHAGPTGSARTDSTKGA